MYSHLVLGVSVAYKLSDDETTLITALLHFFSSLRLAVDGMGAIFLCIMKNGGCDFGRYLH